ncbi:MAG TPA: aminotransferase class I/II-fold pyridoxal phosphate-dependent enzyme [Desulfobacteraceae bacterium]|nr:aminotransferase class I/II-fold pyridoxal phosphate-dependent enzyme [Desulfobacteraceae bacterium]
MPLIAKACVRATPPGPAIPIRTVTINPPCFFCFEIYNICIRHGCQGIKERRQIMDKLAILGGKPVVTIKDPEQWRRPIDRELQLIKELLETDFLSGAGKGLPKQFEDQFQKFIGAKYCLTTCSGTLALQSAFYAVGVGPGDEIIVPAWAYISSYAGALHLGARPVFCDVDPKNMLIDPSDAEKRITDRTKAIVAIHFGGNVCNLEELWEIGRKYGIAIVEDAAHAHGAMWDGKKIGSIGDIVCFSLQGSYSTPQAGKPVAGGEGGIVCTNNRLFYERMLVYCHLHRPELPSELSLPEYRMFDEEGLGLKFRAHPLALAIAKVSLESLEYRIKQTDAFREELFAGLQDLPGVKPEYTYPKAKRISIYGGLKILYYPEELNGLSCEKFVKALQAEGVPVIRGPGSTQKLQHLKPQFARGFDLWGHGRSPIFGEFFGLPCYKGYHKGDFPIAEKLSENFFTMPVYIKPKQKFLNQCLTAFYKVIEKHRDLLKASPQAT